MKWLLAKVQEINQSLGYSKLYLYRSFHHDVTDQEAMHTIGLQIMKGQPSCWCPKKILWGIELFSPIGPNTEIIPLPWPLLYQSKKHTCV